MDKKTPPESEVQIVDLQRYRKNKNEERRREYERVLFNRILGVYSFAEKNSLNHIEVIDISYSGLKFREENPERPLKAEEKVALRFYFTPSSYLKVIVDVKRAIPFKDDDREGMEYGCQLDKSTKSYEVIRELIAFMYKYSETACQDTNPPMIWF
ncbi:MAG: PilZ domain-containing protein [Deltaproteobacteria bacterium]|nr:PilZ domain-containing protein [Deltaproteobacteria bacterium]MBI3295739.1 PilZ domain-containing protein [Deltaproteobacteria bacterium]